MPCPNKLGLLLKALPIWDLIAFPIILPTMSQTKTMEWTYGGGEDQEDGSGPLHTIAMQLVSDSESGSDLGEDQDKGLKVIQNTDAVYTYSEFEESDSDVDIEEVLLNSRAVVITRGPDRPDPPNTNVFSA